MDRESLRLQIIELLEGELAALGYELVDVRLFLGGGRLSIRIYLDRAGGIDLAACAQASRTVDMLLEEKQLLNEAYVIEVSSPGVRRPLRTPAHFAAAVGGRVELKVGRGARPRTLRGELLAAGAEGLRLLAVTGEPAPEDDGDATERDAGPAPVTDAPAELTVAWGDVAAANLDPVFDIHAIINADRRRHRDERRAKREQAREARQARVARRRRPRGE